MGSDRYIEWSHINLNRWKVISGGWMGMEGGDCGTAGQLLDSASSPAIYHFWKGGGGIHVNGSQVAWTHALVFLRTALSGQGEGAARLLPEAVPTWHTCMCSCTRKLSRAPASLCRVTSGHQELHNLTSSDLSSGLEAARPQANLQLVRVSPRIYKKKSPVSKCYPKSHLWTNSGGSWGRT